MANLPAVGSTVHSVSGRSMATNIVAIVLLVANAGLWLHNIVALFRILYA